MRTYLSGLTASGYAHPKIIPGAIYLDKNGNRVTVKELMFDLCILFVMAIHFIVR